MNEHQVKRQLAEMLEIGVVEEVQADPLRYKVRLDDERRTDWIRQGIERAGGTRDWNPYDVDEQVLIAKPLGAQPVIICSLNRNDYPQPETNLEQFYREFKDGSWIRYDRQQHRLEADIKGDATLQANGFIQLHAKGDMYLRADGNIHIDAQTVKVFEGGNP